MLSASNSWAARWSSILVRCCISAGICHTSTNSVQVALRGSPGCPQPVRYTCVRIPARSRAQDQGDKDFSSHTKVHEEALNRELDIIPEARMHQTTVNNGIA